MRVSAVAIVVNVALSLGLLRFTRLEHGALALALSLTSVANMVNYLVLLRRRIGRIDGGRLIRSVLLSGAAALLMGAAVHFTAAATAGWFDLGGSLGRLGHVLLAIGVGVGVYAGTARLLRMDELAFARQMVSRRGAPQPDRGAS